MIEGCTNPGSPLSEKTPWSKGCKVSPIDKNDDCCSSFTLDKCREMLSGKHSSLWFSSPCTGGTSWTHINMHRESSMVDKIQKRCTEFRKLWGRLEEIANFAIPLGVAISIEWPRGCRYWNNPNVVHFLEKYGFKFADFDGCLVASHGKGAGLPIKKPWRVAYVNSSLGEFFHHKCDGSHEHSPCSGRNTSDTERYTPLIAKAVHLCFSRDTKMNRMSCSDDANTLLPTAISVLKLLGSDEHCRGVQPIMAELPQAKAEEWPDVKAGAEAKPEPKSRVWGKRRMFGVGGGGPQGQVGGEKVPEQKLDASGDESPSAEGQWEKTGSDQKVVMGLAGQWGALENARFVPKQGDRRFLMLNISEIATRDLGVMYEWLKDNIISCRYIIPGHDTFRDIKLKTVAMLRKMPDPDGVCGVNVSETRAYRELAKKCSTLFANVAGELICQWTEKDDNDNVCFPANT